VPLELSTHRAGDDVTVAADGVIDLATVGQLEDAIAAAIAADAASVTVDLGRVHLLDSSGIGALLKGRRQADERRRPYRVVGAEGMVAEVLRITGVWDHLVGDAS
jgi:anti-anti-sigma factor